MTVEGFLARDAAWCLFEARIRSLFGIGTTSRIMLHSVEPNTGRPPPYLAMEGSVGTERGTLEILAQDLRLELASSRQIYTNSVCAKLKDSWH